MQDTQELKLPATGKTVLVRGYVTGLIDQEVKKILAGANKARYEVDASDLKQLEGQDMPEVPESGKMVMETDPTAQLRADNKLLELMVLSIDGDNGDVFNKLLALPAQDVNYVTERVKALQAEGEVTAGDPKAPTPTADA